MNLSSTTKHRIGTGLLATFLLLASCDEMQRHKTLSFFFDGVPSQRGEGSAPRLLTPKDKEAVAAAPADTWYVHEPLKDCTQCHGRQPRRGFSSKVQLVADVPQLCYQCHEEIASLPGWVHGPVAAGDCLLCHGAHKTKNAALLTKPAPELCYQCHEVQTIRLIDRHAEEPYARCTDCHEGHASMTKALLRPGIVAAGASSMGVPPISSTAVPAVSSTGILPVAVPEIHGRDAHATHGQDARATKEQGQEAPVTPAKAAAELYYRSLKQYHAGQLQEARDGFLQALRTGLLPEPMRETVIICLEKIDQALQESQRRP